MITPREPGEPLLFRHPIQHYRWSKPSSVFEWLEVYWVPMPIWRVWHRITHPRGYYQDWKHSRKRPKPGGFLMYHDEGPYRVINRDGDDIVIELPGGNATVSWSACCDPVPK